jgi:hypothetical protein
MADIDDQQSGSNQDTENESQHSSNGSDSDVATHTKKKGGTKKRSKPKVIKPKKPKNPKPPKSKKRTDENDGSDVEAEEDSSRQKPSARSKPSKSSKESTGNTSNLPVYPEAEKGKEAVDFAAKIKKRFGKLAKKSANSGPSKPKPVKNESVAERVKARGTNPEGVLIINYDRIHDAKGAMAGYLQLDNSGLLNEIEVLEWEHPNGPLRAFYESLWKDDFGCGHKGIHATEYSINYFCSVILATPGNHITQADIDKGLPVDETRYSVKSDK